MSERGALAVLVRFLLPLRLGAFSAARATLARYRFRQNDDSGDFAHCWAPPGPAPPRGSPGWVSPTNLVLGVGAIPCFVEGFGGVGTGLVMFGVALPARLRHRSGLRPI